MLKLRSLVLVIAIQAAALAADPALLRLVMPDAKVIAGIQVDQSKNSVFGQYVLSHMQVDDQSLSKFIQDTGFDPRRDVREIVIASNWTSTSPQSRWLVLAKGVFDIHKIEHVAEGSGATITNYKGTDIYTYPGQGAQQADNAIAFLDAGSAAVGDLPSVKGAIDRQKSSAAASGQLVAKVGSVSAKNDFWFVTLVPLSEFAGTMPDPNVSGAMRNNMLTAVNQASGGIRFGDTVTLSAEAITRSDKDAQALVDVVKFVVGMLSMNRQDNAAAGQVASLLDTLDCKTTGNVMTLSLAIPERQLEQMIESMEQPSRAPRKKAAPQAN
ncbi:MAG: hypothetical protein LAP38_23425 [Acidobacteriia bacterium]|nr:hypothetical protein [Terriglobia bacterium]